MFGIWDERTVVILGLSSISLSVQATTAKAPVKQQKRYTKRKYLAASECWPLPMSPTAWRPRRRANPWREMARKYTIAEDGRNGIVRLKARRL
jgi:hypothetical protein